MFLSELIKTLPLLIFLFSTDMIYSRIEAPSDFDDMFLNVFSNAVLKTERSKRVFAERLDGQSAIGD